MEKMLEEKKKRLEMEKQQAKPRSIEPIPVPGVEKGK
jgi:hypothetical protein